MPTEQSLYLARKRAEANAAVGVVRLHTQVPKVVEGVDHILGRIQNDLFDLGAMLARKLSGDLLPIATGRVDGTTQNWRLI